MGRVSRIKRERESSKSDYIKEQYAYFGAECPSTITWYGEVCGDRDEISEEDLDAFNDIGGQAAEEAHQKGENKMSWFNWLKPKPTYFDVVTSLVEQTVDLECLLKEDEEACHERLKEIEAARRELKVRVFRG